MGLFIQGGSRGTNILVSLGTKLDIIFNKISVNVLTCQLGLVLNPGKACHTLLDSDCICSIKVPNFSCKRCRRYSEVGFAINYLMVTEDRYLIDTRYMIIKIKKEDLRHIDDGRIDITQQHTYFIIDV